MRLSIRALAVALLAVLVAVWGAPAGAQEPTEPPNRTVTLPEHFGLVDPATGLWHLEGLSSFFYGNPQDVPFMGDWDCNDVDTPGLYRQVDGYVYLRNSNSQGIADVRFFFGDPGDLPVAGDFDGDGCDSVALYRPSESRFYVIDSLGSGGTGLGAATAAFTFGNQGDVPLAGDFDGDGVDEFGVYRPGTGLVYLRHEHGPGAADAAFRFPEAGDRLVAGDWVGWWGHCDEMSCDEPGLLDTLAAFRPAERHFVVSHHNSTGAGVEQAPWGESDWMPVAGRFSQHPADAVRAAMVGTWAGTLSLLDLGPETRDVTMEFRADGTYSIEANDVVTFAWASGGWYAARTWDVHNVERGEGFGPFAIYTPHLDDTWSSWMGPIEVGEDTLTFEIWHRHMRTVGFDLQRTG